MRRQKLRFLDFHNSSVPSLFPLGGEGGGNYKRGNLFRLISSGKGFGLLGYKITEKPNGRISSQ